MLILLILSVLTAAIAVEEFDAISLVDPLIVTTGLYDPTTERCCKGHVHAGSPKAPVQCCGSNIYDVSTQLCCNGTVHDRQIGSICCGTQTYNTKTDICCDNTIARLESGTRLEYTGCCGNKAYDIKKQLCITDYQQGKQVVVTKQSETDDNYCGITTYNARESVCCQDYNTQSTYVLPAEAGKTICCGKHLIGPNELCCDGEVASNISYGSQMSCCGKQIHNYIKQLCCYNPDSLPKIVDKTSETTECCGTEGYDYEKQLCCSNPDGTPKTVDKTSQTTLCCGTEVYDYEKQICCSGTDGVQKPLDRPSPTSACCGHKVYDSEKQTCCNDRVSDNQDGQQECCVNKTINLTTQLCCSTNGLDVAVQKQGPNDKECCGLVTYDDTTSLCCNHNNTLSVVKKTHSGDNLCCGLKTYQYGQDICCEDVSDNGIQLYYDTTHGFYNRKCCGSTSIDTSLGYCCGREEIKYGSATLMFCCGSGDNAKAYNPSTDFCCYDYTNPGVSPRIVSKSLGNACCGQNVFNNTGKELCCKGKLYKRNGTLEYCCGDKLYTYDKEVCCGEDVYKNKGGNYLCCYDSIGDAVEGVLTNGVVKWVQKIKSFLNSIVEPFPIKNTKN